MTVTQIEREMPVEEFEEWVEYALHEPIGEGRADLRAGIIASVIANCHSAKGRTFKPKDFMPTFGDDKPKGKTAEEMIAEFDFMFGLHNQYEANKAKG